MIGRGVPPSSGVSAEDPQGFDAYDLRLGDMMRGERATMGKSLLDVQRELRIRASYIAAIENCDPSAFDTPGFIAGYVRSYARYLGMDPDDAFAQFCAESGFSVAHGMSERASTIRKSAAEPAPRGKPRDPLFDSRTPFATQDESLWSRVEPGAIGATVVMLGLVVGIGYGGWTVLQEVQRVQLSPVDQTPTVLSELDPLASAMSPSAVEGTGDTAGVFSPPEAEWYDRMQRPDVLDVPVLVARDAPISTLDPNDVGLFAGTPGGSLPQVDDSATPFDASPFTGAGRIAVLAARPAYVRIVAEDGVLFSGILNGGESFAVPAGAVAPRVEVGEPGAVYFAVNGQAFGPAGESGTLIEDVALSETALMARFAPANPVQDRALAPLVAELERQRPAADPVADAVAQALGESPAMPRVTGDAPQGVTILATRPVWVRVRAQSGTTLYETTMQPGDSYTVPATEGAPTIRAGDAGAVYFAVNGQTYGPYGGNGAVADNLALSAEVVAADLPPADPGSNAQLARMVAELGIAAR